MPIQSKQQPPYYQQGYNIPTYHALITQTGTNAPIVLELKNTLNATITPAYDSTGVYTLTSSERSFTLNKTSIIIGSPIEVNEQVTAQYNDDGNENQILLISGVNQAPANGVMLLTALLIQVYP